MAVICSALEMNLHYLIHTVAVRHFYHFHVTVLCKGAMWIKSTLSYLF